MPEKDLTERIIVNTARTVYPGSSIASIQVLSVENAPVTFKGLLSDREAGVPGFADAMREALTGMVRRARRCRLLWRNLDLEGVLRRADFSERDKYECGYEMEFEVAAPSAVAEDGGERDLEGIQVAVLQRQKDELERVYEKVFEEIAGPPPGSLVTEEEMLEPETIPPVEFILDPWLDWRIQYEQLQARLRGLLELAGNETLLNIDDATQFGIRTAWVLTNRLRQGVEDWDGTALGLADQLLQIELLSEVAAAVDALRLTLE